MDADEPPTLQHACAHSHGQGGIAVEGPGQELVGYRSHLASSPWTGPFVPDDGEDLWTTA